MHLKHTGFSFSSETVYPTTGTYIILTLTDTAVSTPAVTLAGLPVTLTGAVLGVTRLLTLPAWGPLSLRTAEAYVRINESFETCFGVIQGISHSLCYMSAPG